MDKVAWLMIFLGIAIVAVSVTFYGFIRWLQIVSRDE